VPPARPPTDWWHHGLSEESTLASSGAPGLSEQHQAPFRGAGGPWSSLVFAALLALAAVVRLGVVVNRPLDPDESQHLHTAWLVSQGRVPYRDFWEHHTPGFFYLMAPLTRWLAEQPTVYLGGRLLMTVAALGALALTWRLARRLAPPVAAVTLLAFLPQFAETSTETRPDVPALVAWLASVVAVVRWGEGAERGDGRRQRWLWAAGLGLGVALALSLKAAYGVAGLGLAVALRAWGGASTAERRPLRDRVGAVARGLFSLAGGLAAAVGLLVAWIAWLGGWPTVSRMADQVAGQTWRFVDFSKTRPVHGSEIGFLLLALAGIGLAARRVGRRVLQHPVHGPLLLSLVVIALALSLPRTPAVYQHAWLPVLPILAVYAGVALAWTLDQARATGRPRAWVLATLAIVGGLVVPGAESVVYAVRDQLSGSLRLMTTELRAACPGEPIVDGTGLAVFRPSAHRYGVLVTGVREWIARGAIAEETIEADIRAARAPAAYPDKRLRGLIGPVADFLASHYVAGDDGLLVAGVRLRASGSPGVGRALADLVVPGPYRLVAGPGLQVAIDGAPARHGVVVLTAGRHVVTWTGPAGTIELTLLGCAERRQFQ
jgi:Dolichyl-phosphate-mannose-protein mannosyltransferase